jgi:hypothetical protein
VAQVVENKDEGFFAKSTNMIVTKEILDALTARAITDYYWEIET